LNVASPLSRALPDDLAPADLICRVKFPRERQLPTSTIVHRLPREIGELARHLHFAALQGAYFGTAQFPDEVAEFENYVLPRTRLWNRAGEAAYIVRSKNDDRKTDGAAY
jgi:hypothetical protein